MLLGPKLIPVFLELLIFLTSILLQGQSILHMLQSLHEAMLTPKGFRLSLHPVYDKKVAL